MVAIGGGAGGLVTTIAATVTGAKCALIERGLMGGDCLNTGCVPSKAFLKSANVVHQVKNSAQFGVKIEGSVTVDFSAIMARMRKIRAEISEADAAARMSQ